MKKIADKRAKTVNHLWFWKESVNATQIPLVLTEIQFQCHEKTDFVNCTSKDKNIA